MLILMMILSITWASNSMKILAIIKTLSSKSSSLNKWLAATEMTLNKIKSPNKLLMVMNINLKMLMERKKMSLISIILMNWLLKDLEEFRSRVRKKNSWWTWKETSMTWEVTLLELLMEKVDSNRTKQLVAIHKWWWKMAMNNTLKKVKTIDWLSNISEPYSI